MSDEYWHGTTNGYTNRDCRCVDCRGAWAEWVDEARHQRAARLLVDPTLAPHGRPTTYSNWRCRCRECTVAYSAACADRVRRRKASA